MGSGDDSEFCVVGAAGVKIGCMVGGVGAPPAPGIKPRASSFVTAFYFERTMASGFEGSLYNSTKH